MPKSTKVVKTILEVFDERRQRNPQYSLRAFARDLKVSPSRLCEFLQGKCGISRKSLTSIGSFLGWSEEDIEYANAEVESRFAKNSSLKKISEMKLQAMNISKSSFENLEIDKFRFISDWYHLAIIELKNLSDYHGTASWIAKKLKITKSQAQSAINRLVRIGYGKIEGQEFIPYDQNFSTPVFNSIPSKAIRKFHKQIILRGLETLHSLPPDQRDFSSTIFAINPKHLPELRKKLHQFSEELGFSEGKELSKNVIYCLSAQLFPLSEK